MVTFYKCIESQSRIARLLCQTRTYLHVHASSLNVAQAILQPLGPVHIVPYLPRNQCHSIYKLFRIQLSNCIDKVQRTLYPPVLTKLCMRCKTFFCYVTPYLELYHVYTGASSVFMFSTTFDQLNTFLHICQKKFFPPKYYIVLNILVNQPVNVAHSPINFCVNYLLILYTILTLLTLYTHLQVHQLLIMNYSIRIWRLKGTMQGTLGYYAMYSLQASHAFS